MWLKKKLSELKVIITLLVVVMMVCLTGSLLYKNLSAIAENVTNSTENNTRTSILLRQILIEIREAENNVKSYNLTSDREYLVSFYTSVSAFDLKLEELEDTKIISYRERTIVDSVIILSEERFELLKTQLYADDESKIIDELNAISAKIDETYKENAKEQITGNPAPYNFKDTVKRKESFFKRLFGKKQKKTDTIQNAPIVVRDSVYGKQTKQIGVELKKEVKKVKKAQRAKLTERKKLELKLANEGKNIVDKIRSFSNEMEEVEKESTIQKINSANNDVNTIKTLAIIISAIISLLLLLVSLLIVNYISKKRQYEVALISAKQNAEDLAKTKEAFLANMSHEIKTPLSAIYGFTEQVLKSDLTSKQYQYLTIVKDSTNHLIQLISDILDYSKIQAGKIQIELIDFDIKNELENIKILFTQQCINKNLQLNFMIDIDVPDYINADLTKLKQIMYNVIGNAIKFTDKGSVSVKVKKEVHQHTQYFEIRINDTGIGIPEGKIKKLFNEYEQLHTDMPNKYSGTGLGLVITKKILEHLGGSIQMKSLEHKGTDVTIHFPYSHCDILKYKEETPGISEQLISAVLKNKHILIVDDEQFNRLLLKTILAKFDTNITEAINGNEAVTQVKNNHFDLVLMDVRMPEKDGIVACEEIRLFEKDLIMLASTAVINNEKTNQCLQAGFNGFIFKPFNEKHLLETLYAYLTGQMLIEDEPILKTSTSNKLSFDELFSIANGDEHFKKEMIVIFHKSINEGLQQLESLLIDKEWLKISEIAHKILPSCKHFQANSLYTTLKYFENLREQAPVENQLSIKLQQLKRDVAEVNLELQVYL
ncbi:MAG: response regulator [Burkholderiales bacterium]|nr:response regulator [Bacteroidia bacterium]